MFSKKEIIDILKDDSQNDWLFSFADKVRQDYVGNDVHLRGLIEFSNICKNSCYYCGLRCENKDVNRYRMSPEEIINTAQFGVDLGYRTIVLQSGEDPFYTKDILCDIIREIKKLDVALTLSIGEHSFEDYQSFKNEGLDRYLIRIETTDEFLYKKMHPKMQYKERIQCIKNIKKLGLETGTGCLVGLPNQSIESLADDIVFFKEIDADMVGIGPLIVHPDTPLNGFKNGSFNLALKVMALTRIILKDVNIPATTAMETLQENGRLLALKSGANVVMPNINLANYSKNYQIYPNKVQAGNDALSYKENLVKMIESIGRTVSLSCGFRKKLDL